MVIIWQLAIIIVFLLTFMLTTPHSYASQIEEDLSYLLSGNATMDYNNPKLNKIVSSYDLKLVKYYKAFIDYDKSKKFPKDLKKAKNFLMEVDKNDMAAYPSCHYYSKELINENPTEAFLILLSSKNISDEYILTIPLWLALRHPNILKHTDGRFSPHVNAKYSLNDVAEFKSVKSILFRTMAEHWSAPHGSVVRDIAASNRNFIEKMSFAPSLIINEADTKSIEKNLQGIQAWSSEGLWNRLLYKRFEVEFAKATKALENYYCTNYGLKDYSKYAEFILSKYVYEILSSETTEENCAFQTITKANGDLNKLKRLATNFNQQDKNELLARAILADYDGDTIKWIIQNGADVNTGFMGEMPLMNAANNPELLKILLAFGADTKGQTLFGKTALFYAIQFGNVDSIKILLNAGADINHALNPDLRQKPSGINTKDEDVDERDAYAPINKVYSFTPLVYAKRYADKPVIQFLLSQGAKIGRGDPAIIKEWVNEGKLDL